MRTEIEGLDRIASDEVVFWRASPTNIGALAYDLVPQEILDFFRKVLFGIDGSAEKRVELARAAKRLDSLPAEILNHRDVMLQANPIPDRTRADLKRHVTELCFRDRSRSEREPIHLQSQLQETLRPLNVKLDAHVSQLWSFEKQSPQFYDFVLADDLHAALEFAFSEANQTRRNKMIRCAVCHHQIHMLFWLQVASAFFTAFHKPRLPARRACRPRLHEADLGAYEEAREAGLQPCSRG
ncbi:MAG: hypothetical protein ACRYG4_12120 [Janthinobacterium lividum]